MIDIGDRQDRERFLAPGLAVAAAAGLTAVLLPPLLSRVMPLIAAQQVVQATLAVAAAGLAVAAVVWTGFHALYVRHHVAQRSFAYLPLLFAMTLGIDAGALLVEKVVLVRQSAASQPADETSAPADTAALDTALSESELAMRMVALRQGGRIDLHSDGAGLAADFGRATKAMVDAVAAAFTADYKQTAAMDFPRFLAGDDLEAPGGFPRAHAKLEQMLAIRIRYNHAVGDAIGRYRGWIVAAPLGAGVRRTELAHLDKWAAVDAALRARQLTAEKAFIDECEAMLRGLQHARGAWSAKGQSLVFQDDRDAAIYKAHRDASEADLGRLYAVLAGK
jgi:hypothetical protein